MNKEELELIDGFFNKGWCCDLDEVYKTVMNLQQENEQLKKQLDYLRSGEYLNQLKFERNMLEDIVQNMQVSKEDKEFIDMTHRNTELLEEKEELKKWLEEWIENEEYCYLAINDKDKCRKEVYKEVLDKIKELEEGVLSE